MPASTADSLNQITSTILSTAIAIHRALGPGLLESAYLTCLTRDLADTHLRVETQKAVPLVYRNVRIACAYRADLVVEESVLVEVKTVDVLAPIHDQQVNTYFAPRRLSRRTPTELRRTNHEGRHPTISESVSG
jgi:GxxExxY protein